MVLPWSHTHSLVCCHDSAPSVSDDSPQDLLLRPGFALSRQNIKTSAKAPFLSPSLFVREKLLMDFAPLSCNVVLLHPYILQKSTCFDAFPNFSQVQSSIYSIFWYSCNVASVRQSSCPSGIPRPFTAALAISHESKTSPGGIPRSLSPAITAS